jgi:hypothetical protein
MVADISEQSDLHLHLQGRTERYEYVFTDDSEESLSLASSGLKSREAEDGDSRFSRNVGNVYQTVWHHIPVQRLGLKLEISPCEI